jgi:DNA-binding winged helix-turn-helix (wHTH) protein/tetratricopeptide (TPR) repeat protein
MVPSISNRRIYYFGDFELQVAARVLIREGKRVPVGSKAFEVLTCLVVHAGQVVTKEQLLKTVWPDSYVEEGNLSQHVFALRKALADRAGLIVTIPGRGYQFTGHVRESDLAPPAPIHPEVSEEIVIQTMRERSHVVIEETRPAPAPAPALPSPVPQPPRSNRAWLFGLIAAAALTLAMWAASTRFHRPESNRTHGMLVADFQNTTGDETFDRTLKRALEIDLGQSPSISVMSATEAVSVMQLMGQKSDAALTGEVAREVCVRGNRQVLLAGTIAPVGRAYLLTLEATDCNSGRKIASAKAQASSKEGVLAALDSIADRVRLKLGESAKSLETYQVPIAEGTTPSLDALKAYSMGQYLAVQGKDETDYLGFYQRAIELDPKFAMAYGALANTYYNLNEFDLASANFKKAFDLSGRVSAHEKLILEAHYYDAGLNDVVQAIKVYQLWSATYPSEWAPPVDICNAYAQIGQSLAGLPACEQGLKMQPDRAICYSVLARALKNTNRFAEAKAVGAQAIARGKDSSGLHASLFEVALIEHDADAIARETQWAHDRADSWYAWNFPYLQAEAAARAGQYRLATELFRRSFEAAQHQNLPESAQDILEDQARIELQLGRPALARATLSHLSGTGRDHPDLALERAQLGDIPFAQRFLAAHAGDPATMTAYSWLPLIRATLAIERGKPLDAISALEPAAPFELASYEVPSLRAAAFLKAGRPAQAVMEYRKILANPGIDATSPLYPLAHLGLARALLATADRAAARTEYAAFLAAWKDADPDMPLLKAARAEQAKLQ